MANTITKTTLEDSARNLVVLVSITGDGSGDETNTVLITRSNYAPTDGLKTVVERIKGQLVGFTARLLFDATTKLNIASLPDGNPVDIDWYPINGIASPKAGAGYNGNVLISTSGLGAGEVGVFVLYMRKA